MAENTAGVLAALGVIESKSKRSATGLPIPSRPPLPSQKAPLRKKRVPKRNFNIRTRIEAAGSELQEKALRAEFLGTRLQEGLTNINTIPKSRRDLFKGETGVLGFDESTLSPDAIQLLRSLQNAEDVVADFKAASRKNRRAKNKKKK